MYLWGRERSYLNGRNIVGNHVVIHIDNLGGRERSYLNGMNIVGYHVVIHIDSTWGVGKEDI